MPFEPRYDTIRIPGIEEPIAFIVDRIDVVVNTALSRVELERALEVLIEENHELIRSNRELERVYDHMSVQLQKYQQQHTEEDENE